MNISPNWLFEETDIDPGFGYSFTRGAPPKRTPPRDCVIKIALALRLRIEECDRLLTAAGKSHLYARIPRDLVIMYALQNAWGYDRAQRELEARGIPPLGKKRARRD